jgi:2-methylcitrate dehydratase PrpD
VPTQIEHLSEWIASFTLEKVPERPLKMAKLQVLDCIASIMAGFRSQPGQKIYHALRRMHQDDKGYTLLPTSEKTSLENAVYLHSSLINALELDNFSYMGHLSESAFPVALAISEKIGASETMFLESLICAQEVSGRLGAYLAMGKLQGHMRSFLHRIAAAVATTHLYKCSAEVIANAIAIALASPEWPFFPSSFSPDTKINCVSSATVEGMRSAFLAMEGFDAARDILEHPAGLVKEFSQSKHIPFFWKTLGNTWVMDSISFKYYSSCGYSQGPVNAVLQAKEKWMGHPDDIQKINLYSPLLTVVMEELSRPHHRAGLTPVNINFSTKRSVSVAVLYGGPDGDFFAGGNDRTYHPSIEALSKKVQIFHDWGYTLQMIKGIDACLSNAGYPGVFDFGTSDKTLKSLRKVYKNRTIFSIAEFRKLMELPKEDLFYLIRRILRSQWGLRGLTDKKAFEADLSRLVFAIGSRAEIHTVSGKIYEGHCTIPRGFAGDLQQEERVFEKFKRECSPLFGEAQTTQWLRHTYETGYPLIN